MKNIIFIILLLIPCIMNAQKKKLVFTPIDLGDIKITITNENTIEKAYQWLIEKRSSRRG
jgi:hypothetical protein